MAMDKREFAAIMAGMRAAYPRFKIAETPEAVELWYKKLSQYPANIVGAAVSHWIDTHKFPPSIAEMRDLCTPKTSPALEEDWGGAWEKALKVIQHYGSYREAEALESLRAKSPKASEALRRLGYRAACLSENLAQERANFRMIYEAMGEYEARVEAYEALPDALKKNDIDGVIDTMAKALGGEMWN